MRSQTKQTDRPVYGQYHAYCLRDSAPSPSPPWIFSAVYVKHRYLRVTQALLALIGALVASKKVVHPSSVFEWVFEYVAPKILTSDNSECENSADEAFLSRFLSSSHILSTISLLDYPIIP